MKNLLSKKRSVPKERRKYGKPESKKDALIRLKEEKEIENKKKEMQSEIKNKNKDEFHFEYYSTERNMIRREKLTEEELKKTLKYIDSEIVRCERKLENYCRPLKNVTKFTDESNEDEIEDNEYVKYIKELKIKREVVYNKLKECKSDKK